MCSGGLFTNIKPRSRGYKKPLFALHEHEKHLEPPALKNNKKELNKIQINVIDCKFTW
jgi:hypothetical protein